MCCIMQHARARAPATVSLVRMSLAEGGRRYMGMASLRDQPVMGMPLAVVRRARATSIGHHHGTWSGVGMRSKKCSAACIHASMAATRKLPGGHRRSQACKRDGRMHAQPSGLRLVQQASPFTHSKRCVTGKW